MRGNRIYGVAYVHYSGSDIVFASGLYLVDCIVNIVGKLFERAFRAYFAFEPFNSVLYFLNYLRRSFQRF